MTVFRWSILFRTAEVGTGAGDLKVKAYTKETLARLGLINPAIQARDYLRSVKFIRSNFDYFVRGTDDGIQIPPLSLIVLVTGKPDIRLFLETGRLAVSSIRETLMKQGLRPEDFTSMLDFGCGCGRVTRYWKDLANTTICGADYNDRLLGWCKGYLDFGLFQRNSLYPPLEYNESSFDFIYALSVFTHLTQDLQVAWMNELVRILRPGGYLLISTHGEYYLSQLNEAERISFLSGNLVVKSHGPVGSNLLGAYHPVKYVSETLSKGLSLMDFVPQGAKGNPFQDIYLFRKKQ